MREGIALLIEEDLNLLRGHVLVGGNEHIFGRWVRFSPILKISRKGLGEVGTVHNW